MDDASHYMDLMRAFVRGRLGVDATVDDDRLVRMAAAAGLRLHKFKRSAELPRVAAVLGTLRGLDPTSVLDIGSGRGVFLWPLLDAFPGVAITASDHDAGRVADIRAVGQGGITRVWAEQVDAHALPFDAATFDVVTILEVLEHVAEPAIVAREVVRVARRFVVASVPSQPDDNPEHIRLFDGASLTALLVDAGATRVSLEFVHNHILATATIDGSRQVPTHAPPRGLTPRTG